MNKTYHWLCEADYEDGTSVSYTVPYNEHDNYEAECKRQYDLEADLICRHEGCISYSVVCQEDD